MEVLTMTWTKERINLLVDLWLSGKSASNVAKEIGNVSRNAVIGKVHRLGIANRVNVKKTSQSHKNDPDKIRTRIDKPQKTLKKRNPLNHSDIYKEQTLKTKISSVKIHHPPRPYGKQIVLARDPNAPIQLKKLSLFELKENNCRWPSGDPKSNDFHFCGCPTEGNTPYCAYHARIAYAQTSKRESKQYIVVDSKPASPEEFNDGMSIEMVAINTDNNENLQYI